MYTSLKWTTGHFSCHLIMDILYLWDKLALICHWLSVHIRYLFCTCLMPYSLYSYCLIYCCHISEIFKKKCRNSLNPSSTFSVSVQWLQLLFAMTVWMIVKLWATVANIRSSHFSLSIHCTIVYLDPALWYQKCPKLCSMSSNKISDAFFLWSCLWLFV